jgi:hypothetical protein
MPKLGFQMPEVPELRLQMAELGFQKPEFRFQISGSGFSGSVIFGLGVFRLSVFGVVVFKSYLLKYYHEMTLMYYNHLKLSVLNVTPVVVCRAL